VDPKDGSAVMAAADFATLVTQLRRVQLAEQVRDRDRVTARARMTQARRVQLAEQAIPTLTLTLILTLALTLTLTLTLTLGPDPGPDPWP
jgi:hypothetical protein